MSSGPAFEASWPDDAATALDDAATAKVVLIESDQFGDRAGGSRTTDRKFR
jgi:hypothetical protein